MPSRTPAAERAARRRERRKRGVRVAPCEYGDWHIAGLIQGNFLNPLDAQIPEAIADAIMDATEKQIEEICVTRDVSTNPAGRTKPATREAENGE